MTLKEFYRKHKKEIEAAVINALKEDKASRDVTTEWLFNRQQGDKVISAELLCKEDCVLAGIDVFGKVFRTLHAGTILRSFYKDGDRIRNKSVVLTVKSPLRVLLEGERTALNFLQRMSGIATLTDLFVRRLKYKNAKILHTRKTTPNFRIFELAAVKTGGGDFHRFDLASSVMIKDNHIASAGSIENVLELVKNRKNALKVKKNFEIEVCSMAELLNVVNNAGGIVRVVMLDNFNRAEIPEAVKILRKNNIKTELSGGINLKNFEKLQVKGIDYYSIGMLTHSYKSVNFSLEF